MSNISNLTSKILKDAEERKDSILAKAESEKASIIEKRNKEAKALEAEMIEKAKSEAQTRKERVISGAELKARNEKLKAKQAIIEEVFIKESILTLGIAGDEKLILNEKGKSLVDNTLLVDINKELTSKGKKGLLTISTEVGNFKGGFILEKGGIEINNTFEALVSSLKDELEFEVANELFN